MAEYKRRMNIFIFVLIDYGGIIDIAGDAGEVSERFVLNRCIAFAKITARTDGEYQKKNWHDQMKMFFGGDGHEYLGAAFPARNYYKKRE